MKIGVRQGPDNIEVIAIEGGRRVGKLDAQPLSWDDLMEASNEAVEKAQAARERGLEREATAAMQDARVLERCARSYERLRQQSGRQIDLFAVVSASMDPTVADRDAQIARMYRAAAVVAGRRGAALMAEPCAQHLFGPADLELARRAWTHPGFLRGMLRSGPVVYPSPSARTANLKRSLL